MQANEAESAMVGVAQDCIRRAKREYAESQRSFGVHCPALYDQFIDGLCEALDY